MQLKNQKDIQNKEHEIEKEEIRLVETISKNNKETLEDANNKGFYIVIMVFLLVIFLFYKEEYSFGVALVSISGALGAIINAFNKKENNTIKKEDNIEE
jgi:dolichol kinase